LLPVSRLSSFCASALVLGLGSGCAQRIAPPLREISVHEYLFGAFGGSALDVRDICPSGEASDFEIRRSASAYALSIVSLGLYLPHQVRVRCRETSAR
jgi:hypothetical protein